MLVSKFDNKLKNDGYNVSQWRPEMRRRNFFLQHNSFKDARRHLISFVFVREPFTRIVSCYHDKMDRDWSLPQFDLRVARCLILNLHCSGTTCNQEPLKSPGQQSYLKNLKTQFWEEYLKFLPLSNSYGSKTTPQKFF